MASTTASAVNLPVVLTTQTAYPLPTHKYMIPANWRRYQLSQLINKALSLEKPIPFDFLVRGEILRTSLSEWCAEHGVGEEETLEIEYIESVLPPEKMTEIPHEDWVSSVSCHLSGQFVTGSYDGQVRSFDYSKNVTSATLAHTAPITSVSVIPSSSQTLIATASQDLTGQILELNLNQNNPSKPLATLHLHTAPLSSIASNASGSHLLTASWDGLIGLWDTTVPEEDEVPDQTTERDRKKRRKLEEPVGGKAKRKAPLSVLKSHTARVTKAVFGGNDGLKGYSCGWDSTIRLWDVENGVCTQTITAAEKPFTNLSITPSGTSILATSTDRTLTHYDLRSNSNSLSTSAGSFLHPATPSCVTLGSGGEQQVITGAYDGVVRLWDLRSVKGNGAMVSFKAWDASGGKEGGKKVLDVDWVKGVVGVGGEGGFEVWKMSEERT